MAQCEKLMICKSNVTPSSNTSKFQLIFQKNLKNGPIKKCFPSLTFKKCPRCPHFKAPPVTNLSTWKTLILSQILLDTVLVKISQFNVKRQQFWNWGFFWELATPPFSYTFRRAELKSYEWLDDCYSWGNIANVTNFEPRAFIYRPG